MGKKSRAKRERREQASFMAALTACEDTWLERPATPEEQARIDAAFQELKKHRALALAFGDDVDEANRFSLDMFRDERFAPLQFEDWVIESVLDQLDEPPVVEDPNDTAFSDYLRQAVTLVSSARVRRIMADQVRRFLPQYVEAGQIKEAIAIDYNAYLTVMSDASTPLLVQMLVGGMARWYDEYEEEFGEEEASEAEAEKQSEAEEQLQ